MFKRKIETTINEYLDSDKETTLIIEGARQIGKTYIINKLAKAKFKNYIEINLKDDFDGERNFEHAKVNTADKFYLAVSSLFGDKLGTREDTIIFLDEIQVYPHLLSMLKPLNKEKKVFLYS